MPAPGAGEVLVEIHAVSLNYRDVEGKCWPFDPGYSVCQLIILTCIFQSPTESISTTRAPNKMPPSSLARICAELSHKSVPA